MTTAYAPGAHLNETTISLERGIGRTPVREALHRLAQNGLVDIIPRKGVIVRPFSLDEIAHVIDVRLLTEPACATQAALRVSRAQLEVPKAILHATQIAINKNRRQRLLQNPLRSRNA